MPSAATGVAALAAAVAALLPSPASALLPTVVTAASCSSSFSPPTVWKIDAPSTTAPNTVRFDTVVSTASFNGTTTGDGVTFAVEGSLGIPDHPLGVFKFEANGSACGTQTAYVMDGVLGQLLLHFPPCPWTAGAPVNFTVHTDVWTVLPILPPLLASGLEFELHLNTPAASSSDVEEQLCLKLDLAQPPQEGAVKSQDVCTMDDPSKSSPTPYPPTDPKQLLPTVTVDLDKPASQRWVDIVTPRKAAIKDLVDTFTDLIIKHNGTARALIELLLNGVAEKEMQRMPKDYADEMRGIASATGIGVGSIWVLNMMYEVIGACTSFIAHDANGQIWHGRNLDFGLFMGSDPETHTWLITDKLRPILMNVEFTRGGKSLYNSTTYAGFIGLLSGSKAGAFSITVNTRYDGTFLEGLIGWFLGKNNDCQFLTFETRMAIEDNATYADALDTLVQYKPLGPAYIIIGGIKPDEGAVIAKHFNVSAEEHHEPMPNHDVWFMNESLKEGSFYVAETNYDRLKPPPEFDDRIYPLMNCLETVGASGISAASVWKILSSNPTMNALTTFSTVMSAGAGHFEAYLQECSPGPTCSPF